MQNSVVVLTFSAFPFLGRFGPKSQNNQFKLKFGTKTNLNMQILTFVVLEQKYPFWANLLQNIKISSLS